MDENQENQEIGQEIPENNVTDFAAAKQELEEKAQSEIGIALSPSSMKVINENCYYFVTAEWITIEQPKLIATMENQQTETVVRQHKENIFINFHPAILYLKKRMELHQFVVTMQMQITRKMYEAALEISKQTLKEMEERVKKAEEEQNKNV